MIVAERQSDPFGDVLTITMAKIDVGEPRASLFQIPQGSRLIRDEGVRANHVEGGAGWPIIPPDYDPNRGFGSFGYTFTVSDFGFLAPTR